MRSARDNEVAVHIPCAHDSCSDSAIIHQKLPSGLANLCQHHYEFHHQRQADAFCKSQGLVTTAQKYAWIKEKLHGIAAKITGGRTPGEDDE